MHTALFDYFIKEDAEEEEKKQSEFIYSKLNPDVRLKVLNPFDCKEVVKYCFYQLSKLL